MTPSYILSAGLVYRLQPIFPFPRSLRDVHATAHDVAEAVLGLFWGVPDCPVGMSSLSPAVCRLSVAPGVAPPCPSCPLINGSLSRAGPRPWAAATGNIGKRLTGLGCVLDPEGSSCQAVLHMAPRSSMYYWTRGLPSIDSRSKMPCGRIPIIVNNTWYRPTGSCQSLERGVSK